MNRSLTLIKWKKLHYIALKFTLLGKNSRFSSSAVDVIDQFTKKLISEKQRKWNKFNESDTSLSFTNFSIHNELIKKINCFSLLKENTLFIDFSQLTDEQISYLIGQALDVDQNKDVDELLEKCFKSQRLLFPEILHKLLNTYCQHRKIDKIEQLKAYVEKSNPNLYWKNACYDHYLAKALYLSGNTEKALKLFRKCFLEFELKRNEIASAVCDIMFHVVREGSEASLVICIREAESFSTSYREHRILQSIWKALWSSQRHSDQCLSRELLNTHTILKDYIKEKGAIISAAALKYDSDEDAVARLLQDMLFFKMMDTYSKVLHVLFNFRVRAGNTKGCKEIIKHCKILNIDLPLNHGKYVVMLINTSPPKKKPYEF